jgi:hypothetical protein
MRIDISISIGGLFLLDDKLDFHTLTYPTQQRRLRVRVFNSGPGEVWLSAIRAEGVCVCVVVVVVVVVGVGVGVVVVVFVVDCVVEL